MLIYRRNVSGEMIDSVVHHQFANYNERRKKEDYHKNAERNPTILIALN